MTVSDATLKPLLARLHSQEKLRVWSMVITIFGDMIVPRGGVVTLGSLQTILGRLNIEPNALRTALSRLARDGWIERIKNGRQSSYRLAKSGEGLFADATQRIYSGKRAQWSGRFDMVLVPQDARIGLADLDRELAAQEFGSPQTGLYIRPYVIQTELILPQDVICFQADGFQGRSPSQLAALAWPLDDLSMEYQAFTKNYEPIRDALDQTAKADDLDSLALRLLLIHDWRRICLRDPRLPAELLSEGWAGDRAFQLAGEIYQKLLPASERALDAFEAEPGMHLVTRDPSVFSRFTI